MFNRIKVDHLHQHLKISKSEFKKIMKKHY